MGIFKQVMFNEFEIEYSLDGLKATGPTLPRIAKKLGLRGIRQFGTYDCAFSLIYTSY
jgi:hypothetical protein